MENATEILIIILSVVLTLFLIVSIVLAVILIKLARSIRQIAEKADGVVGNVEAASAALKNVAGPLATGKFVMNIVDMVLKKKRKG